MLLFMGGSLVCGVSSSSTVFIIGRAIGGIGSGGVFTGSITITAFTVPLHKRPRFVGSLTGLLWVLQFSIRSSADFGDCKFCGPNSRWTIHG